MGRFATGVTVLTTRVRDLDHAMTASALTSVSLEPMLLLVCVEREGRFHDAVVEAGVWGVSVLSAHDRPGADWLATRGRPLHAQLDRIRTTAARRPGWPCWTMPSRRSSAAPPRCIRPATTASWSDKSFR